MKKIFLLGAIAFIVLVTVGVFFHLYKDRSSEEVASVPVKKTITIGIISSQANSSYETMIQSMKEELKAVDYDIVYVQNPNITNDTFTKTAEDYVGQNVDIILANSSNAIKAALAATSSIPLVFGSVGDPVNVGIAASMDSSGNNTTGVSSFAVDLTPRRLQVLTETFPEIKKVYFFHEPGFTSSDLARGKTIEKAKELGVVLIEKPIKNPEEVKEVALTLKSSEAQGILLSASSMIWGQVAALVKVQDSQKIPIAGIDKTMISSGVAFSYGPDYAVMGKQVAELISEIIKGVKPADLPIQKPKKVEFIINNKVLKANGLKADPAAFQSADLIVE